VRPPRAEEPPYAGGDPAAYAISLAEAKTSSTGAEVVIGADTVVVIDGAVLGKPGGAVEAATMLRALSGRTHEVITGVAVRDGGRLRSGHERTAVTFRALAPEEIDSYAATCEPLDKAGAYAFQGGAAGFVVGLEGPRDNVVGLPISLVQRLLPEDVRRSVRDEPADGE
jgi:septum formation protein